MMQKKQLKIKTKSRFRQKKNKLSFKNKIVFVNKFHDFIFSIILLPLKLN